MPYSKTMYSDWSPHITVLSHHISKIMEHDIAKTSETIMSLLLETGYIEKIDKVGAFINIQLKKSITELEINRILYNSSNEEVNLILTSVNFDSNMSINYMNIIDGEIYACCLESRGKKVKRIVLINDSIEQLAMKELVNDKIVNTPSMLRHAVSKLYLSNALNLESKELELFYDDVKKDILKYHEKVNILTVSRFAQDKKKQKYTLDSLKTSLTTDTHSETVYDNQSFIVYKQGETMTCGGGYLMVLHDSVSHTQTFLVASTGDIKMIAKTVQQSLPVEKLVVLDVDMDANATSFVLAKDSFFEKAGLNNDIIKATRGASIGLEISLPFNEILLFESVLERVIFEKNINQLTESIKKTSKKVSRKKTIDQHDPDVILLDYKLRALSSLL